MYAIWGGGQVVAVVARDTHSVPHPGMGQAGPVRRQRQAPIPNPSPTADHVTRCTVLPVQLLVNGHRPVCRRVPDACIPTALHSAHSTYQASPTYTLTTSGTPLADVVSITGRESPSSKGTRMMYARQCSGPGRLAERLERSCALVVVLVILDLGLGVRLHAVTQRPAWFGQPTALCTAPCPLLR